MMKSTTEYPMQKRKIRLIMILSFILTVGFLATTLASYFVSKALLRTEILENELPLTSDSIYSEIQRDLLQPIFISSLMATNTFLRDWVIDGEKDESLICRYLNEIKVQYDTVTSFFVSENTKIYYQASGVLKTVTMEDKRDGWYFRVREMVSDYEINVDPDMANQDTMTIFINYRVYDYGGKYIGAVGVGLTVSSVKALIETYQEQYNREIYFISQNGDIVLHGSGFPDHIKRVADVDGLAPLAARILSTSQNSFYYKKDGVSFMLNTRYIPEFKWYVLVEQSESKALQRIFHTLFINIAICIIIILIVLCFTNITVSVYQKTLEEMATLDKLTGLYNRQAFSILFKEVIKEVHRRFLPFSLIIMDIDNFKIVNDTYGHVAGDAVLKHVSSVAGIVIRDSDVLCRWGGEEFMFLLKECKIDDAFVMAEKIRKAIAASSCSWSDKEILVTVSLGISQWNLLDDRDEESIVVRADQALYMAKGDGRNRTVKLV